VLPRVVLTVAAVLLPEAAFAAELDGRSFAIVWALPFLGILMSIAILPLLAHHFWESHYGKIAAFWAALIVVAMAVGLGAEATIQATAHTVLLEYVPFILLLLALFTVAGGVLVRGNIHGAPLTNTGLLCLGALLASFIGTTGASMVIIRPIIRANDDRRHNVHVVVFFIFLVANIGGSLTPLGDPPLFLGFLRGVDFFWTTQHLILETIFVGGIVLAVFFVLDSWLYRKEGRIQPDPTPDNPVRVTGGVNFVLIGVIIGAILFSANVDLGRLSVLGAELAVANLVRDGAMAAVTLISLATTPNAIRVENSFTWGPILEVAKLFAAIFITIIPVLAMLRAGPDGVFAPLIAMVSNPDGTPNNVTYFWITGGLSSFLDNAPTYLVFFELAGGDPARLMSEGALTLAAISAGAVFMGANTYIGNAPNFMVYAMAKAAGVQMPSFFGFMLWSGAVLVPVFLLTGFVFFR
jgi:Na+/H+ antiporter NhaD/arsenite permease-like protein